ncbi:hypothetical protein [Delftia phage PhiW-14]|uniref:DUF551 domain-containing protein n=1 Tax=Delftia phage PhiW-14 TaxID=665032 RepID=C9DGF8_BPW14|nr:hypothetical protein DP-phiW-14_gp188 [Delftia phage PhiW-14]ACV50209.1 hypothetical protein [Delftia phage PhiW-14]
MKYTDEQLIQAGRKAKIKGANGLDIMTRPEAKYAMKNSLPLSMVRAFADQLPALPPEWTLVSHSLPSDRVDVLIGYWYQDTYLKGDPWVWATGVGMLIPDRNPCFEHGVRWHTGGLGCSHSQVYAWMPIPTPPPREQPKVYEQRVKRNRKKT